MISMISIDSSQNLIHCDVDYIWSVRSPLKDGLINYDSSYISSNEKHDYVLYTCRGIVVAECDHTCRSVRSREEFNRKWSSVLKSIHIVMIFTQIHSRTNGFNWNRFAQQRFSLKSIYTAMNKNMTNVVFQSAIYEPKSDQSCVTICDCGYFWIKRRTKQCFNLWSTKIDRNQRYFHGWDLQWRRSLWARVHDATVRGKTLKNRTWTEIKRWSM